MDERARCLATWVAAGVGCSLTLVTFYPGYVSPDSIAQLTEARTLTFAGLHPPMMSLAWALTDRLVPGPGGMLILHSVAFWSALGLLGAGIAPRRLWLALSLVAVGLTPPAPALLNTVWKDIGLAASLLLAGALITSARVTGRRWIACTALPPLFYAAAVRHNALPGLVPLAYLWSATVHGRRAASVVWGWTLVLLFAGGVGVSALSRAVVADGSPYPAQTILIYDLAGISVRANQLILPRYLRRGVTLDTLSARYAPWAVHPLVGPPQALLRMTSDAGEYAELKRTWSRNVRVHWREYLAHRWDVFSLSVGIGPSCYPFHPSPHAGVAEATIRELGFSYAAASPVRDWAMRMFERCAAGPLFRAWVWLALAALVATFGFVSRLASLPTLALSTSALLYGLPLFLVGVGCDFRMQFWTFVGASVSMLLLVDDVLERRRRRESARHA